MTEIRGQGWEHHSKEEKTVPMNLLLDFYSELLSDGQREALEYFYSDDLTLSEIASLTEITRQGVRDRILKGERVLLDTESKLGLVARFQEQKAALLTIATRLEALRGLCGARGEGEIDRIKDMIEALL